MHTRSTRCNLFIFYCTLNHEDAYDNSMERYYLRRKSYKASAVHANRFRYERGYLKRTHAHVQLVHFVVCKLKTRIQQHK